MTARRCALPGGVLTGLGVSVSALKAVYGVFKAFETRKEAAPFPTQVAEAMTALFPAANRDKYGFLVGFSC